MRQEALGDMRVPLRLRPGYNATIMTIGAVIAAIASSSLVMDAFILRSGPRAVTLGCDVSSRLSCSTVSSNGWSNLLHVQGVPMPNALLGMVAFPLFIGFGVALMAGFRPNHLLRALMILGMTLAGCGAVFLLVVSIGIIGVLCPWCLTMDAGVLLVIIGGVRWMISTGGGPAKVTGSWVSMVLELIPFALLALVAAFAMT